MRSPLAPVNANIPNASPTTAHKRLPPADDAAAAGYRTPGRPLPSSQRDYTPRHPQSPPAYTPSGAGGGDLHDRGENESFFTNSLLIPVPQSAAFKRRIISPIRPDSENSASDPRKYSRARKSLSSTEGKWRHLYLGSVDAVCIGTLDKTGNSLFEYVPPRGRLAM